MGKKKIGNVPKSNKIKIVDDQQDQLSFEGSNSNPQNKSKKMISKENNKKQPVQNSGPTEIADQAPNTRTGRPKKEQTPVTVAKNKSNKIEIVDDQQDQLSFEGSNSNPQNKSKKVISKENNKKQPVQNSGPTEIADQAPNTRTGRPKKEQTPVTVAENQAIQIVGVVLQLLENIGLKHGLVFRPQDRRILNKESLGLRMKKIEYTDKHEWKKQTQLQKLRTEKHLNIINHYVEKLGNELKAEHIIGIILYISSFMAQEFTDQFYDIVDEILTSLNMNESQGQKQERAAQLFDQIKFMSGKFTKKNVKYWIEIEKDESERKKKFIEAFLKLCRQFDRCFNKTNLVIAFVKEQEEMHRALQFIADGGEEKSMVDEEA